MPVLLQPLRLPLLLLCLSTVLTLFHLFPQAAAQINCVRTKVGRPTGSPPPLPPECEGVGRQPDTTGSPSTGRGIVPPVGPNDWGFPLQNPNVVTGVFSEMASYGGEFSYAGHIEHAGLDIGTPVQARVPVFAVADGVVIESRLLGGSPTCSGNPPGCNVTIQHAKDRFNSWYTHIDSFVTVGQNVKRGEQIGVINIWPVQGGYNDHLHFELRLQQNNWNINPRNYFPQLNKFPPVGYGNDVRAFSASRGVYLAEDGKEWAETFRDHPPCLWDLTPGYCWAM